MTEISVVLPTYNGTPFLEDQLESIVAQSRTPDEIVITDDASTDGTWELVERYAKQYPDTVQARQNDERLGVTGNFERGIDAADGDLVFLSDQDDLWQPNKIQRQLDAYRATDVGLVCHNSQILNSDRRLWEQLYRGHEPGTGTDPRECLRELTLRNFVQGASIMFDAELKTHVLPIPEGWMYDHFLAYVAAALRGIADLPDTLVAYRQHDSQERGAAGGIRAKFRDEMARPPARYRGYEHWWRTLRDRLAQIDRAEFTVEKAFVMDLLDRRVMFNAHRAAIHDPANGLYRRVTAYARTLRDGGYVSVGHRELAVLDLLAVLFGDSP